MNIALDFPVTKLTYKNEHQVLFVAFSYTSPNEAEPHGRICTNYPSFAGGNHLIVSERK
jgi:hypothetical protein